jgi:hypothetical protein
MTMGYTMALFATHVDELLDELRQPSIDPATIVDDTGLVAALAPEWDALAATVADALAHGGGELSGALAQYVHAVISTRGHWYGALWHTSSGGETFRRDLLPGPLALRFGREAIARLVNRDLGGLTWNDHPYIGYLTTTELTEALNHTGHSPEAEPDGTEDDDAVATLEGAVERAVSFGLDLVSVYG